MNATGGLGKGLGELFARTDGIQNPRPGVQPASNTASAPLGDGSYLAELPVRSISPNPRQPRQVFDEDELRELADSLREIGLLQPIVVRRRGSESYEIIMGERRWRAAQLAGLASLPAIVRATDDSAMLTDALLENLQRVQLNPLEEAAAYQQLMNDFNITQDELATRIKRSRPQISNTIRLLKLPPTVQRKIAAGVLSAGHARALLGLPDADRQERLATKIIAEGLSVRATEELVTLQTRGAAKPARATVAKDPDPRLEQIAYRLEDRLDTRVRVEMGKRHGRITIEFAGADDLERLVELLDPASNS